MCAIATKTKWLYTGNVNEKRRIVQGSGSIVRLSMTASRAADPGSNPGRSTKEFSLDFKKKNCFL
jgi:hypothetical protein